MQKPYLIATIVAVFGLLWIGSGVIIPSDNGDDVTAGQSQTPDDAVMSVAVQVMSPQAYQQKIIVNGMSFASKDVVLKSEVSGQIIDVIANEGDNVTKGQSILKIDIQEKQQLVAEARELKKQREIEYNATKTLFEQGYASDVALAQAKSSFQAAKASLSRAVLDLEKTNVTAPFDGVLGVRAIDQGDYVGVGDDLVNIVDLTPLKITVYVNEKDVVKFHKGNHAVVQFVEGNRIEGVVDFIAPSANTQTRTFQVDVLIDNDGDAPLPAGLTAQVDILLDEVAAYQIPSSIITLGDDGVVGVRVVDGDNKVRFVPIHILNDSADLIWVQGLNDGARVITVGQDFVGDGQIVNPVMKEGQERDNVID